MTIGTYAGTYADHAPAACGPAHHWMIDPSDEVCRCEGPPHTHGVCKFCGECKTWPVWVEWDYRNAMQALAVMMGVHKGDEAPKGGVI